MTELGNQVQKGLGITRTQDNITPIAHRIDGLDQMGEAIVPREIERNERRGRLGGLGRWLASRSGSGTCHSLGIARLFVRTTREDQFRLFGHGSRLILASSTMTCNALKSERLFHLSPQTGQARGGTRSEQARGRRSRAAQDRGYGPRHCMIDPTIIPHRHTIGGCRSPRLGAGGSADQRPPGANAGPIARFEDFVRFAAGSPSLPDMSSLKRSRGRTFSACEACQMVSKVAFWSPRSMLLTWARSTPMRSATVSWLNRACSRNRRTLAPKSLRMSIRRIGGNRVLWRYVL